MTTNSLRITLTFLAFLSLFVLVACGPLGPIPGGKLRGTIHSGAMPSIEQLGATETVQLETSPDDPHSVNTWISHYQGALYIPTSLVLGVDEPGDRDWVKNVSRDDRVRVRIKGVVYPMRMIRVEAPAEREAARNALLAKYETQIDEHAENAWIYRLERRDALGD